MQKLLIPVGAFLRAGGISKEEAQKIFSTSYGKGSGSLKRRRKIGHVGSAAQYDDVITLWKRDKRFLDAKDRPLFLGSNSFSVKAANTSSKASKVLSTYCRYHMVELSKNGIYALTEPYFTTSTPDIVAYEPLDRFMSDATATVGRMLKLRRKSGECEAFWRTVDSANIVSNPKRYKRVRLSVFTIRDF